MKRSSRAHRPIILFMFALLLLGLPAMLFAESRADFSGSWFLDPTNGISNEMVLLMPILKIAQDDAAMTVSRSCGCPDTEDSAWTDHYALDGSQAVSAAGNRTTQVSAAWTDDNRTLVVTTKTVAARAQGKSEIVLVDRYSLAEGGRVLEIDSTSTSPSGVDHALGIYNRN